MKLKEIFNTNKYTINKWSNYFDIYEKHFSPYINTNVVMLEIGVQHGGSLKMWKEYFGKNSVIIGIDINPDCKKHEDIDSNIHVRIGSQVDENFLLNTFEEFKDIDIILDDGSHNMEHVYSTFNILYPLLKNNSIYMVEDLEHAYYPSSCCDVSENFINKTKENIDLMHAEASQCVIGNKKIKINELMTNNTFCISCYEGIVCYEKQKKLMSRQNIWSKYME